jgi:hypothetical protein
VSDLQKLTVDCEKSRRLPEAWNEQRHAATGMTLCVTVGRVSFPICGNICKPIAGKVLIALVTSTVNNSPVSGDLLSMKLCIVKCLFVRNNVS